MPTLRLKSRQLHRPKQRAGEAGERVNRSSRFNPRIKGKIVMRTSPQDPPAAPGKSKNEAPCFKETGLIRRAVIDSHGGKWFQCGTGQTLCWASLSEIQGSFSDVLKGFGLRGIPLVTAKAKAEFQQEVQDRVDFSTGAVTTQAGWIENAYVFGDGTIVKSKKDALIEVLPVFDIEEKFGSRGTLRDYNSRLTPLIKGQTLPLAAMAFALVGPLLKFAPSHIAENPLLEISGPKQSGKTTLAIMAMSVWAGEPGSTVGGGDTWDTTEGAIDGHKRSHSDCLLFFDEGSLDHTGGPLTLRTIWKLSTSSSRRRMGESRAKPIRLAFLSTTNIPLAKLSGGRDPKIEAMLSRMVTLTVGADAPHGVMDSIPAPHEDGKAAIRALKSIVTDVYGVASRAYIKHLVKKIARDGDNALRQEIARHVDRFELESGAKGNTDDRVANTFALMFAAAHIAKEAGVVPGAWKGIRRRLITLYRKHAGTATPAIKQVQAYCEQSQDRLRRVKNTKAMPRDEFENAPGFLRTRNNNRELLISPVAFKSAFANAEAILKQLRDSKPSHLDHEAGKYTRQVPRIICKEGKVHVIILSKVAPKKG